MPRKRSRNYVVPEARLGMEYFKAEVMRNEGFNVTLTEPNNVKFEVAKHMGIPLRQGYNGDLQAASAGKIGGKIGGAMVREMVRMAQKSMAQQTTER